LKLNWNLLIGLQETAPEKVANFREKLKKVSAEGRSSEAQGFQD
jgi:hypothetical protein